MTVLTMAAWVAVGLAAAGDLAADDGVGDKIDAHLASLSEAEKWSGSVLIAVDGEPLLRKGYGLADREHQVPNSPKTKFRVGSITKQFTAVAILQLEEQAKLSVQDLICKHMPGCPESWAQVTIHHLLTHTAGVPNLTAFPGFGEMVLQPSRPEKTILSFRDMPLEFEPGDRFKYSNSGYVLLAHVIEEVSGTAYELYLREHILDPAGMKNSGSDSHAQIIEGRADGYTLREGELINAPYIDMSLPIGGGNLYSTVDDLLRWDQALHGDALAKRSTLARVFAAHAEGYGYGWMVGERQGRAALFHDGGINGFSAFISRYPEERVLLVLLSNFAHVDIRELATEIEGMVFENKGASLRADDPSPP